MVTDGFFVISLAKVAHCERLIMLMYMQTCFPLAPPEHHFLGFRMALCSPFKFILMHELLAWRSSFRVAPRHHVSEIWVVMRDCLSFFLMPAGVAKTIICGRKLCSFSVASCFAEWFGGWGNVCMVCHLTCIGD